jgi:hypothetical protein
MVWGGVAAVLVSFALASSPAAATDSNSGTIDTTTSTGGIQKDVTAQGDDCGGVCKRINWCGKGDDPTGQLSDDAPYVRVDGGKGEPKCVEKPAIGYRCCVPNKGSTANVHVEVTNPNSVKLKIRVSIDNGTPVAKWVDGNSTAKYTFAGVTNGNHVIRSAVAADKDVWCKFVDKKIDVKCANSSPSPSSSSSEAPSPAPSVSATVAVPPGNATPSLPVTGPAVLIYTAVGVTLVAGGVWLYRRSRRNHVKFVA